MHQSLRFRADLKSINITCITCIKLPSIAFNLRRIFSKKKTSNKLIKRQKKCEMDESGALNAKIIDLNLI